LANNTNKVEALDEILISADSHVVEPSDLWVTRLPAAMRDRAPNFKNALASRGGRPPLNLQDPDHEVVKISAESKPLSYEDRRAGRDPLERVKAMAVDGVSAEVLYPSVGGRLFHLQDAALQEACFRVYNDWLIEYCKAAPDRLFGIMTISTYDVDHAIEELTRCKKEGLRGAAIWQYPPRELSFTSDHYERFWAAAQDLGIPVSLHISTGHGPTKDFRTLHGIESYRCSINGRAQEVTDALLDIILSGVLERFPKLKVVVVENEIGWIPFWLGQCDKYFERHRMIEPLAITKRPSEYFYRQIYATFFNDEVGGRLLSWWGVDNCMWSSDYPHSNTTWPDSRRVVARDMGHLPAAARAKLVRTNAAQLYKLQVPA
jgi:predicted TIM-barrel fold metal-dependent hydrolase